MSIIVQKYLSSGDPRWAEENGEVSGDVSTNNEERMPFNLNFLDQNAELHRLQLEAGEMIFVLGPVDIHTIAKHGLTP